MLVDRIETFVREPGSGSFDELALAAFRFQYEEIEPYRRLCDAQGVTPDGVSSWREVPMVPTLAFKSQALHAAEPRETFRSSGTRGSERSVHRHPYPDLYRAVIDSSFPEACLGGSEERVPMLSLIPDRERMPESSLSFMIDHVLARWGAESSITAIGPRGVDVPAARSWLGARQRERRPVVILATSLALAQLLDALERRYLHFRLAPGSVLFETGGFKGETRVLSPAEQLARTEEFLGLEVGGVVREYGMTELTSQAWATDGSEVYRVPPWMRVRVLAPETLEEADAGDTGLLSFFDLGNVGSVAHVLTEDLGTAVEGGFRLLGRASDAELRGCSLTVEALASS